MKREGQDLPAREQLDSLLLDGLNSGDPLPVDSEFWNNLRHEALVMPEARRKATALIETAIE